MSWTGVTDADGYKVQWKSGGQSYDASSRQHAVSGHSITSYTIPNLEARTEYTVRVIANRSDVDGRPSAESTGTPTGTVSPANFTVSAAPHAIKEGESATVTVAISNGVTFAEDQTLSLTASGTASAADYTGVPATLTLVAGGSSVTADLAASDDQEEEEHETVTVAASHGGASIGSATVTITSVSHDATLSALSLSGVDIGAFSSETTAYAASAGHAVETTTVTAAASHAEASVSIDPGATVSLAEGANQITVEVRAEDGETTRTYTVTVTRASVPQVSIAPVSSAVTEASATTQLT